MRRNKMVKISGKAKFWWNSPNGGNKKGIMCFSATLDDGKKLFGTVLTDQKRVEDAIRKSINHQLEGLPMEAWESKTEEIFPNWRQPVWEMNL